MGEGSIFDPNISMFSKESSNRVEKQLPNIESVSYRSKATHASQKPFEVRTIVLEPKPELEPHSQVKPSSGTPFIKEFKEESKTSREHDREAGRQQVQKAYASPSNRNPFANPSGNASENSPSQTRNVQPKNLFSSLQDEKMLAKNSHKS